MSQFAQKSRGGNLSIGVFGDRSLLIIFTFFCNDLANFLLIFSLFFFSFFFFFFVCIALILRVFVGFFCVFFLCFFSCFFYTFGGIFPPASMNAFTIGSASDTKSAFCIGDQSCMLLRVSHWRQATR